MALCVRVLKQPGDRLFPFNFEHPSCANVPMQTLPPCEISWVDYAVNTSNCFPASKCRRQLPPNLAGPGQFWIQQKTWSHWKNAPPGRFDGTKACVLEPVGRNPPFGKATALASADHVCNLHASCLIIEVCLYIHRVSATSTSCLSNETAKQLRLVVVLPVPPEFLDPTIPVYHYRAVFHGRCQ